MPELGCLSRVGVRYYQGMRGASNEHMDYMRSRRTYVRTDPLDRLLAKTERTESGCLIYIGKALKNGYPVASVGHDGGLLVVPENKSEIRLLGRY